MIELLGLFLIGATPGGQYPGYLIHDRDRVYGTDFASPVARLGIESIRTPVQALRANAIAERVVRSLRQECLDHILALGERHVRSVLAEFASYYNRDRPHRSLGLEPPVRAIARSSEGWSLGRSSTAYTTSVSEPPDPDSALPPLQAVSCVLRSRARS